MANPILEALAAQEKTQAWLAKKCGRSPQLINDIVLGRHGCGGKTAVAISRALDGAVSVEAILTWKPKRRRRKSPRTAQRAAS